MTKNVILAEVMYETKHAFNYNSVRKETAWGLIAQGLDEGREQGRATRHWGGRTNHSSRNQGGGGRTREATETMLAN